MQIYIHANEFDNVLRNHITARITSVLYRFQRLIRRIEVRLTDQNGPKGGVDMCCLVRINADSLPEIVIKDTEADGYAAVSRALARARRTLARRLSRAQSVGHQRLLLEEE